MLLFSLRTRHAPPSRVYHFASPDARQLAVRLADAMRRHHRCFPEPRPAVIHLSAPTLRLLPNPAGGERRPVLSHALLLELPPDPVRAEEIAAAQAGRLWDAARELLTLPPETTPEGPAR